MIYTPPPRHRLPDVTITPWSALMGSLTRSGVGTPVSNTWPSNMVRFFPLYLLEPYPVAKGFWLNGSVINAGTFWDLGVYRMTDPATGRLDAIRTSGAIASQGTASAVFAVPAWHIAIVNLTSGNSSTDATSYATASVTLKAGKLYLISVENSHGSSATAVSTITGGPTFTSRSTTQYNTSLNRVSIWSAVPTVDYTGTLTIDFGATTQTGACWSIEEFTGVNTTTNHGIVQNAVGTGNSGTALATLAAFGSTDNATFGAHGHAAATASAPGTGFTEMADQTTATPAQALETAWRVDNDTTVDATFTSAQWGSCAVELAVDTSPLIIPPAVRGDIYMGFGSTGGSGTVFETGPNLATMRLQGMLEKAVFPLPSSVPSPITVSNQFQMPMAGFSLRTLLD